VFCSQVTSKRMIY